MLEVRLLGQFDVRLDGTPVEIPSRPAQSLLAYLLLSAGTAHRREQLAGLFWPDANEGNARAYLRQALWRIRQALTAGRPAGADYLLADNISVAFDASAPCWLDAAVLQGALSGAPAGAAQGLDALVAMVAVYRGELLPGFYDEWAVLERERLQAVFEQKIARLLDGLVQEGRWPEVLEWGERWIVLGQAPEPAYRALMIAHAASGDRAKVAAVFRRCIEALGAALGVEPSDQTRTLHELLARGELPAGVARDLSPQALADAPAPGPPPFKGLQYFDEADAGMFFGRELLIAKLAAHLREYRPLAVVVGASGSGKSSVVRAGLIPALKRGAPLVDGTLPPDGSASWAVHVMTPTAHPLQALAASLTHDAPSGLARITLMDDLARDARGLRLFLATIEPQRHLLLVVDQFEELFTLCRDEAERQAFVDNLLTAAAPAAGGLLSVVIALRADFYAHCAQFANLRAALATRQEYIGPMSTAELRRAIEAPAQLGGWQFEPGLVDLLLSDAGGEPGALPLLSHALLETWKRRRSRTLTVVGYGASGGLRRAIAQTAETVFQRFSPDQQAIARGIFLRLTELGEGTQDSRRRVPLTELLPRPQDAAAVEAVLTRLADVRLITTGEGTAEVAHEALIREWPTLREWLNENRDGLRLHRHLTEAAQAWDSLQRDPGELYRGARLVQAREWAAANAPALNALEQAFLDASVARAEHDEADREAQRQRELDVAQKLAAAEKRRAEEQGRAAARLRRRALYLGGALLLALVMAASALFFAALAGAAAGRNAELTLQAQRAARTAQSREWAAAALGNLDVDPELSMLLALHAVSQTYGVDRTALPDAVDALHRAVQASRVQLTLAGHHNVVMGVAFSPDGTRLATASFDGTTKLWQLAPRLAANGAPDPVPKAPVALVTLPSRFNPNARTGWPFIDLAFSQDGTRLTTLDAGDVAGTTMVRVWDVSGGAGAARPVLTTTLAVSPKAITRTATSPDFTARNGFSADGSRVATAMVDGTAKIWDVTTGKLLRTLSGHTAPLNKVAFSPAGTRLATASDDGTTTVWDALTGKELFTLVEHGGPVLTLAFSPDGTRLATAGWNATARIWDMNNGQLLLTLYGHASKISGIAFSADGRLLATASLDRKAKLWEAATGRELLTLSGHTDQVYDVAFSPDGTRLATCGFDGTAKIWAVSASLEQLTLSGHSDGVSDLVISPDGTRLATASFDRTAKIWDIATGVDLLTLSGHSRGIWSIDFSPDGTRVATGSDDTTGKIWDTLTGKELMTLTGHTSGIHDIDFSPDGTRLVTGSFDGKAMTWDAASGQALRTLAADSVFVHSVAFSPDGARLATAGAEGTAKIWEFATGKLLRTLTGHGRSIWGSVFSPDGTRLATASRDSTAKVWDLATGQVLLTLAGHTNTVSDVAFSRDGTRLATISTDGTSKVWDAASGQNLLTLASSTAGGGGVAFTADGTRLLAGSGDGTVRIYFLRADDLIAFARARLTRTWTPDECQRFLHLASCPAAD